MGGWASPGSEGPTPELREPSMVGLEVWLFPVGNGEALKSLYEDKRS